MFRQGVHPVRWRGFSLPGKGGAGMLLLQISVTPMMRIAVPGQPVSPCRLGWPIRCHGGSRARRTGGAAQGPEDCFSSFSVSAWCNRVPVPAPRCLLSVDKGKTEPLIQTISWIPEITGYSYGWPIGRMERMRAERSPYASRTGIK